MTRSLKVKIEKKVLLLLIFSILIFSLYAQTDAEKREAFVASSMNYLGTPYKYGGTSKSGIDCSGFVMSSARDSGAASLPRTAAAMYNFANPIADVQREKGDLVFFATDGDFSVSHVGIYIGNNQFIHAASAGTKTGVIISSLSENYWKNAYVSSGQIINAAGIKDTYIADSGSGNSDGGFFSSGNFALDLSGYLTWNLYTPEDFLFNIKGGSIQAQFRTDMWKFNPGIMLDVRYDNKSNNIVQIPLSIVLNINGDKLLDYRVYTGIVLTLGDPILQTTQTELEAPVFFGIAGISMQTAKIKVGPVKLSIIQDFSFSFFKGKNESLSFANTLIAGTLFSSGICVTLPF